MSTANHTTIAHTMPASQSSVRSDAARSMNSSEPRFEPAGLYAKMVPFLGLIIAAACLLLLRQKDMPFTEFTLCYDKPMQ